MSHLVRFFDIDGTILKQEYVTTGADATAPITPNIDPTYLVFAEWNQPFTNVQSDLDVGAMYDTVDGKTYIFVRITNTTGFQPTIRLVKTNTAALTIDWGDGTTNTTTTSGNVTVQKTDPYATIGDYIISIDSGSLYRGGFGSTPGGSDQNLFNTISMASSILKIYMGSQMSIGHSAFNNSRSMIFCSLEKSFVFTTTGGVNIWRTFKDNHSLIHLNIPKNSVGFDNEVFLNCFKLKTISVPPGVITFLNNQIFTNCINLLKFPIGQITTMSTGGNTPYFSGCRNLQNEIDINVTQIPPSFLNNCNSIPSVNFLQNVTSVNSSAFGGCSRLTEMELPASLTSIAAGAFINCTAILEYTFLSTTPPTLGSTNAFTGINAACKIYVPDANVNDYKTATNWSTYANYIYPLSTKP